MSRGESQVSLRTPSQWLEIVGELGSSRWPSGFHSKQNRHPETAESMAQTYSKQRTKNMSTNSRRCHCVTIRCDSNYCPQVSSPCTSSSDALWVPFRALPVVTYDKQGLTEEVLYICKSREDQNALPGAF